ncbi:MAG: UDP-2,3-diacylglucosamine diphosphatase LpxG [Chlamydiales bacterium]
MSLFIDFISTLSVVGIWPRFIEPRLVSTTYLDWSLSLANAHLDGLKIVQFSDLHFHKNVSDKFLDRVARRILRAKPDVILFTGDFICHSRLEERERLKNFLCRLHAPHGCFCIFGNHDYANYVTRIRSGLYDVARPIHPFKGMVRGILTLLSSKQITSEISAAAAATKQHDELISLLHETPFTLLENMTETLPIGLNVTGLGDYSLGRCRPDTAFAGYLTHLPGLILSHNPDTFPQLLNYPGDWVFAGHTHGEQIHFPFPHFMRNLSRKLARLEHSTYTRGLFHVGGKQLYVTRGIGGHKPFRLCSIPEIVVVTGKKCK